MSDQTRRPDLEIVCAHGIEGGTAEFVQRFRWQHGVWMPKDTTGEKYTIIGGPEPPFVSPEALADAPAGRQFLNTECRAVVNGVRCRDKVAMEWERGQIALTVLWNRAREVLAGLGLESVNGAPLRFALTDLRKAYDGVPRAVRGDKPL